MEFKANCTAVGVIELFKMNVYFLNPVQWKKKKKPSKIRNNGKMIRDFP